MSSPIPSLSDRPSPSDRDRADRRVVAATGLLVVGVVLVGLNSRVAFGQIGPLAPAIGWSTAVVTALGLIPPLVMGLAAPLAPLVRTRLGEERGILAASIVVLAGCLARMAGIPGLLAGTVVVSVGIAVINVLVPVLLRSRFAERRVGLMMGVYAVAMGGGSAVGVAATLPVLRAAGGSWPVSIGIAAIPALIAVLGMVLPATRAARPPQARIPDRAAASGPHDEHRPVARTRLGWSLLAFFGLLTMLFYTTLAWLPTILIAHGTSPATAAEGQTAFVLGVAIGGLLAPIIGGRMRDQRPTVMGLLIVSAAGYLGVLCGATSGTAAWCLLLGAGLGAGQALGGVLYARRGRDHAHTAALSAFAQTFGYLLAAAGPLLASLLAAATGGWTAPLWAFLAVLPLIALLSGPAAAPARRG